MASTPTKRKPYRRTKRPKNYNDKSTITTCTPTAAAETPNVYDAVLGEAEDLLRAATDAQAVGRLKMASNYLLLLHARLVGLGKKFDRASCKPTMAESSSLKPTKLDMSPERPNKRKGATLAVCDDGDVPAAAAAAAPQGEEDPGTPRKLPPVPPSNIISEAALNQLTNYLPSNIELDQAMVEHLARAAAELHQKRTGKKTADEGLLNSPAMNTEEVFHYNKDLPSDNTKYAASGGQNNKRLKLAIGWSDQEKKNFQDALQKVGTNDAQKIAQIMKTRSEAEVRAYLENMDDLHVGSAMLEETAPRKRGGRGRKPPTTAMNTVPNAKLDAKAMLQGNFFGL